MAFTNSEQHSIAKKVREFLDWRRAPESIRPQLDFGFRIKGQSVGIFEIRPHWKDASITTETEVAKTTWVRTQTVWKVYWMRRDEKWHAYRPAPEVRSIEAFLRLVDEDEYGCFWG